MADESMNGGDHFVDNDVNGATHDTPSATPTTAKAPLSKDVENVMYSDIGINTLLNRLKQSIASSKDFADFLKRRSAIEEDHAKGLRRIAKLTTDNIHSKDSRQGSYVHQLEDAMRVHDRIADNGMQFALSLHQMHEDLNDLSLSMERGRKHWKHEGLSAEKRAADAENAMEKAKAKYDSLAEDYDRARTGDAKSTRRIGLKGVKNAAQHEEDLLRKLQAADSDYQAKVQAAKTQREDLIKNGRPQAVKALQELVTECDSGLALQLQKFATFNEKLLLGNGLAVSPLPPADASSGAQHSLRDIVLGIDNHQDFSNYMSSHISKIPVPSDIKYEQHPTLQPKQQTPAPFIHQPSHSISQPPQSGPVPVIQEPAPFVEQQVPYQPSVSPPTSRNTSQSYPVEPPYPTDPPQPLQQYNNNPPYPTNSLPDRGYQPPTTVASPYGTAPTMGQQQSYTETRARSPGPSATLPPPVNPVFGVSLEKLYERDGTAVPMIVYQCMQAVDLFGLDVEGIYRLSGTASHIQAIKALFDNDSASVDFRNPAAFYHDVNSAAGLLKQFFRELPDPLLTHRGYNALIEAARVEDPTIRRDSVHAVINALPDPNYATLRALVLHLNRVQAHYPKNRMNASNLAICFAPSLLGGGSQFAETNLQARVVDTILTNTLQIFEDD